MKLFKFSLVAIWLLSVVACSPVRTIGIETYNPAGVTFPKEVKKVLLVNHAVPQPEVPYESTLKTQPDTLKIAADSAVFDFCRTLGMEIASSSYFEDVRLLEEGYRTDSYFFSDRMLTGGDVSLLCREHEVDAVISLDRLMFRIKESAQKSFWLDFEGWIDIEVSGTVRVYLPEHNEPLTSILIVDTIYPRLYSAGGFDFTPTFVSAEQLLREAAMTVAERSLVNFAPYWNSDTRWYYVSSNAQWREATAYAASDKWSQASDKWKIIYDKTTDASWKQKARLASNLALSHELTGDFSKALYWATESVRLLEGKLNENDNFFKLQKKYTDVLEYRIIANKRLHKQIEE